MPPSYETDPQAARRTLYRRALCHLPLLAKHERELGEFRNAFVHTLKPTRIQRKGPQLHIHLNLPNLLPPHALALALSCLLLTICAIDMTRHKAADTVAAVHAPPEARLRVVRGA